jgi:hypothetical protein
MTRITSLLLALALLATNTLSASEPVKLTPEEQQRWEQLAPGIPMTEALFEAMKAAVFDLPLTVEERIAAIARMSGVEPTDGRPRLSRRICIWDMLGREGPIFNAAMAQRERVLKFGIDLQMVPYTSETVIAEELKAGLCDAALMSGLRARQFNKYSGTIDAVGALPSQDHLKVILEAISHPSNAGKMVDENFVVLGIFPAGTAYVFVNDRSITTLAKAAGKRVAVLESDRIQSHMISSIGAIPVPSDFVTAPSRFNNGTIDILPAPLVAYRTLELYKGMSPDGGIVRVPLAQLTMQLIGRRDKFPNEIAQLVRESAMENYDLVMSFIREETRQVPDKWWIEVPPADHTEYETMMQSARVALREESYYDGEMLTLQRKVRCKFDPSRAECSMNVE